jgi:hypothetical protein
MYLFKKKLNFFYFKYLFKFKSFLRIYDQWMFVMFASLFFLINLSFFLWFLNSYRVILDLKKQDKEYINLFKNYKNLDQFTILKYYKIELND